jgi:four helix bundle protein
MEKPHKKLDVWKMAIELVSGVYRATDSFPAREIYGLTDQIRPAAVQMLSGLIRHQSRKT